MTFEATAARFRRHEFLELAQVLSLSNKTKKFARFFAQLTVGQMMRSEMFN
jgi:hypothetical protein